MGRKIGINWLSFLPYLPQILRFPLIRARLGLRFNLPPELTIKLAETTDELKQAFEVLYETYLERGLTEEHNEKLRLTKYHALPSTAVIIAKWKDEVIGTVTVIGDNPLGLPVDELSDLSSFRAQGLKIAEISAFGIKKSSPMGRGATIFPLVRAIFEYGRKYTGTEICVIATHPRVKDFYGAVLGFRPVDNRVTTSSLVQNAKAFCQFIDLRPQILEKWFKKTYRRSQESKNAFLYFLTDPRPLKNIFLPQGTFFRAQNPVLTPKRMDYFFNQKTKVLEMLTEREKFRLKEIYFYSEFKKIIDRHNVVAQIRKRKARFLVNCQGACTIEEQHRISMHFVNVLDVSEHGLRARIARQLGVNEVVNMQLHLGPKVVIQIKCRVVWTSAIQHGLELIGNPAPEWLQMIQSFEKELLGESSHHRQIAVP